MKNQRFSKKGLLLGALALGLVLALILCAAAALRPQGQTGGTVQRPTRPVQDAPAKPTAATEPTAEAETENESEPASEAPAEDGPWAEDLAIPTEFCVLHYPIRWKDAVRTQYAQSDTGGALTFYGTAGGRETALFTVLFSREAGSGGEIVGVLNRKDGPVLVSILLAELTLGGGWKEGELQTLSEMREDHRYLAGSLAAEPEFSGDVGAFFPEQPLGDLEVATPYGVLRYPSEWRDYVWTEFTEAGDGGFVTFYGAAGGEDVNLFSIHFASGERGCTNIGWLYDNGRSIEIGLQMPQDPDTLSGEALDTVMQMREGVNRVLDSLRALPGFTTEQVEELPQGDGEGLAVATPYGQLWLPAQWGERLTALVDTAENGCTVRISGTLEEDSVPLYALYFGAAALKGEPVGALRFEGASVPVNAEIHALDTASGWTAEELDALCAMQESINYLLEQLTEMEHFTPAA